MENARDIRKKGQSEKTILTPKSQKMKELGRGSI